MGSYDIVNHTDIFTMYNDLHYYQCQNDHSECNNLYFYITPITSCHNYSLYFMHLLLFPNSNNDSFPVKLLFTSNMSPSRPKLLHTFSSVINKSVWFAVLALKSPSKQNAKTDESAVNLAISFSIIWAASWQNQQCDCAHSEDSDQPGHSPSLIRVFTVRMKKAWTLSYPLAQSEDFDQTGRMPRLIWVFAGRTATLLVLSQGGSYLVWGLLF